jgi:hypothetical protein
MFNFKVYDTLHLTMCDLDAGSGVWYNVYFLSTGQVHVYASVATTNTWLDE